MATILTKKSDTASSVPTSGALTNSSGGAEIAVNTADKRLFTKDSGGTVVELGTNPSSLSLPNGTANGVPYLNGSKVLTSGSALTFDGTNFAVGNTSPSRKFEVTGSGDVYALVETTGTTGTVGYLFGDSASDSVGRIEYVHASDVMQFTTGGTERMRLTSTGLGIGTSSPSYLLDAKTSATGTAAGDNTVGYFGSLASGRDANIRFGDSVNASARIGYLSGALYLYTNAAERARINTSGNFLLGTTTNHYATTNRTVFNINGTSSSIIGMESGDATAGYLYADSSNFSINSEGTRTLGLSVGGAGVITFATNGSERLRIDSSGNVGIGTSSPQNDSGYKSLTLNGTSGGQVGFKINDTLTHNIYGDSSALALVAGGSAPMKFIMGITERMRLDSSGNLGLGVTPSAWTSGKSLEVNAVGTGLWGAFGNTYLSNNYYYNGSDRFAGTGYVTQYIQVPSTGKHQWMVSTASGAAGGLATLSQAMTLDASGRLGIGLTSPSSRLNILQTGDNYDTGISVKALSGNANRLYIGIDNATSTARVATDNHDLQIQAGSAKAVTFYTNSAERARIDSSGNLGLGVTPSAWNAGKAFEIGGVGAALWNANNAGDIFLTSNVYYNGGFKYAATNAASYYEQNAGVHKWGIASSGTAGNAISFTQAMTLNANGQLLLGTTSAGTTDAPLIVSNAGAAGMEFSPTAISGENRLLSYNRSSSSYAGFTLSAADIKFQTGGTERARIDSSGNLLVGTTSVSTWGGKVTIQQDSSTTFYPLSINNTAAGSTSYVVVDFYRSAARTGYISNTNTATAYNTTSDYRLKENVQPLSGALARVAALKPCTYTWKSAPDEIGEGFIAHELAEVCPQAVTGEKDAVDVDGNPVYQGIDTSFLVATLTAAIQEQQAIINDLKARLDAANL